MKGKPEDEEICGNCVFFAINWATTQIGILGNREWYCLEHCGSPFFDYRVHPEDKCNCRPSKFRGRVWYEGVR